MTAFLTCGAAAAAAPAPLPRSVAALEGCWSGRGDAVGKPVTVSLTSRPILDGAMLVVDVDSRAVNDAKDHYAAHLVFGGTGAQVGGDVVGFWSDTFGGAYAIMGRGESQPDGFDVTYPYPDDSFVNRWRLMQGELRWSVVERTGAGPEKAFAAYVLRKTPCP